MLREAKDVEGLLKVKQQRATEPHGRPTCKDGLQGEEERTSASQRKQLSSQYLGSQW